MMDDPWQASSLEDFHFYCCPECPDVKLHAKELFVRHALDHHPKATTSIQQFLIKTEIHEYEFEENDNYSYSEEYDDQQQFSNSNIKEEENNEEMYQNIKEDPEFNENIYNNENSTMVDDPNAEILSCKSCGKIFTNRVNLDDHFSCVHEGLRKHQCDFCEKSFGYKSNLSIHLKRAHHRPHGREKSNSEEDIGKSQKCEQCGKIFTTKCNLQMHIKSVHEGKRDHICKFCAVRFAAKQNLQNHIAKSHDAENDIPIIDTDNTLADNMIENLEKVKEEKKSKLRKCEICKTDKLYSKTNYRVHMGHVHDIWKFGSKSKDFLCKFCGMGYTTELWLISHIERYHDAEKDVPMDNSYLESLKNGENVIKNKSGKMQKCKLCNDDFVHRDLKSHMRDMHRKDKKPIICDQCGKTFTAEHTRKQHVKVQHQGIREHVCTGKTLMP